MHAFVSFFVVKPIGVKLKFLVLFPGLLVTVEFVVHDHKLKRFKCAISVQSEHFALVKAVLASLRVVVNVHALKSSEVLRREQKVVKH